MIRQNDDLIALGTDKALLTGSAYTDDRHLTARQSLYDFQTPKHDLPGMVAKEIEGQAGIVLDVGCGNGRYVKHLRQARPDLTVVGVDISPGITEDIGPPVLIADAMDLPYPAGAVNVILALHMLYHLPDVDAGLREFVRLLKPDGVLVVSTNARSDKSELKELWQRAATNEFRGEAAVPRMSLSATFTLEDAPGILGRHFRSVRTIDLKSTISLTDAAPALGYLASYKSFTEKLGIPLDTVLQSADKHVRKSIAETGSFEVQCHGGILVCQDPVA